MIFALQNWLSETSEQSKTAGQPGILSVGMSGESSLGSIVYTVAVKLTLCSDLSGFCESPDPNPLIARITGRCLT